MGGRITDLGCLALGFDFFSSSSVRLAWCIIPSFPLYLQRQMRSLFLFAFALVLAGQGKSYSWWWTTVSDLTSFASSPGTERRHWWLRWECHGR
jgi:hypothetical protein